ncbi:MAG TPA: NAD(P)H-dependent oxidoreductase subunit E [bacterium]|nr:NAD(P)H-dependent oxidoreductase subunit E [bacterium]
MAIDMERAETLVENFRRSDASLIELLLDVQDEFNYVPEKVLIMAAERLHVPLERILGLSTFYNAFSGAPQGRSHVKVCTGTACIVRGAQAILEKVIDETGVAPGETSDDGDVSLESVHCVGACALGPIIVANEEYYGHVTTTKAGEIIRKLKEGAAEEEKVTAA